MNEKCIYDLNHDPCATISANKVDAYFTFGTSEENDTTIYLDNSWGCAAIDLEPIIKNGETITTMFLTPKDLPTSLQFNREDYGRDYAADGGVDCIHGDDLSRIISMQLLKDVDQTKPIKNGYVYMFNGTTNLFEPFDLKTFYDQTQATLANHESRIDDLEAGLQALAEHVEQLRIYFQRLIDALDNRVSIIEEKITPPAGTPSNARIVHGNINVYGDCGSGTSKSWGIYSHSPNTNVTNDQMFA